jgi:hypothetical protein
MLAFMTNCTFITEIILAIFALNHVERVFHASNALKFGKLLNVGDKVFGV